MKSLLSRFSLLGAMVAVGCASLPAQDPEPYRSVAYSEEELDNLVAPVALYPDALLAHILVAATFPEQVAIASRYVRERGTRNIENQGWDISVKAVAYYPPVLNMLASDEDWSIALGQAYANQSGDVMDAVQRLREMAREQGNLVSTREHTVTEDRGRIIIVPANPQVIYVPTYDPAIVYVRPIWSFGFHTGYFSFGIGFPIGSWLVYEPDWWGSYGHRVYYHGWYGDGWRYYARRHFTIYPVYHRPRYSIVNININIFNRYPNYYNLDRRHRYVRRTVAFERHDRGGRYSDRDDRRGAYNGPRGGNGDSWNGDDRRGPGGGGRDGNDRIGDRIATFDDYRPDRGGTGSDAREAEPAVTRSGFGTIDKQKQNGSTRSNNGGAELRGSRPDVPVFTSMPRSTERKANGNGNGNTRSSELRSAPRPNAPVYTAPQRSTKAPKGRPQPSESRSAPRSKAPVLSAPQRSTERKSNGNSRPQSSELRSAPRSKAPVFSAPQRSVERKSSGGGGGGAQFNRAPTRSAPSVSRPSGGGGGAQVNRPTTRSVPSVSRPSGGGGGAQFNRAPARSAPSVSRPSGSSGGGGGKVKQSGGGGGGSPRAGGGKGRKQ